MISSVDSERAHIEQNARLIDKQDSDENTLSISKSQQDLVKKLDDCKIPLEMIATDVSDISNHVKASERVNILNWLSPIPFASHHDRARDGLLAGTGKWLLDEEAFGQWSSTEAPPVLWLHGIPGAGKTKLASLVVDHVQKSIEPSVDAVVYFYCVRDTAEPERGETDQILKCLARQLAYHQPSSTIRTEAVERYEALTLGGTQTRTLGIGDTLELIALLVADLSTLTIIIDALDECTNIPALLGHLGSLMEEHQRVRVFLTSRDEKTVLDWLQTVPHRAILIGENSSDLASFVKSEVDNSPKLSRLFSSSANPNLKGKVVQTLTDGAQGMFRWVSLQLQRITGPGMNTERDVLNALSEPLEGLAAVYEKIYEQINHSGSESKALAERALKLLTCCLQPLSTTSLLAAISLPKQSILDAGMLATLCCNLVVEDKELGIFRFPHQSVREYLEHRPDYAVPCVNVVAAQMCLLYLTKPKLVGRPSQETGSAVPEHIVTLNEGPNSLHDYAALYWPLHIQRSGDRRQSSEIPALITSFLLRRRANQTFVNWMKNARNLSRVLEWSGTEQTRIYMDLRDALEASFCDPPNPWFLACVFGIPEVIEKGLPPPEATYNEIGLGPLHLACKYRNSEVVKQLLLKGADLDEKDIHGHKPLFYAVPDVQTTQLLLDHTVNVEVSEDIIFKVIVESSRSSEEEAIEVLEQLMKRGGEATITEEMIERTAVSGAGKLIARLYDWASDDVEITQNVLRLAATWGNSAGLFRCLYELEPGLKATSEILAIATSFPIDAEGEKSEAIEALLEMCDPEESRIPVEALQSAADNSNTGMLEFIFQKNPDIEVPADLLRIAARNRNDGAKMTEYLLKRKPRLNVTWETLLGAAANETPEQALGVTKLLLAHDPILEVNNDVLHHAARFGNRDMLRYLLDQRPALHVSQELVEDSIKSYTMFGKCAVGLLIERNPNAVVSMDLLVEAAARVEKAEFELLWNKCDQPSVTQGLLVAASSNYYPEVLGFLLNRDTEIMPSQECFQKALDRKLSIPTKEKETLDLLLGRSRDFILSETTYSAAIECNSETSIYFLGKFKTLAPTEQTWKSAACLQDIHCHGGCTVLRILWGRGLRPTNVAALVESAARRGSMASVEFLLEQKPIKGLKEQWLPIAQFMQTVTSYSEHPEKTVQALLDKGVNPDMRSDVDGCTPLLMAAATGCTDIVAMLLNTNAVDLETTEFETGQNSLMAAASQGYTEIVKLLLEQGADKNAKDAKGKTAFELAEKSKLSDEVLEMLRL
jgi:ankyrin repeat protein